jgi:hypothetical protein
MLSLALSSAFRNEKRRCLCVSRARVSFRRIAEMAFLFELVGGCSAMSQHPVDFLICFMISLLLSEDHVLLAVLGTTLMKYLFPIYLFFSYTLSPHSYHDLTFGGTHAHVSSSSLGLFFRSFSSYHRSRFRVRRLFFQEYLKQQQRQLEPGTRHNREDNSKTSISSNDSNWRANGK